MKHPIDAEYFEPPEKRERGTGYGWLVVAAFIALTCIFLIVLGWSVT